MGSQLIVMKPSTFFNHLDLEKWKNDDGSFEVLLDVQEIHKDESGDIASGVYYTLLDVALGSAVSEKAGGFGVTIDLHVQVFRQAGCKKLVCKAKPGHTTGNSGSGIGYIYDEEGTHIATGMASFKVIEALK